MLSHNKTDRSKPVRWFVLTKKLFSLGSAYGANTSAGTAVDAGSSVYFVLAITGMDCVYGALSFTSATADAVRVDYVCH